MNVNDILGRYNAGEISRDEANKQLSEAGANFRLVPKEGDGRWTEAEMEQGFFDTGEKPVRLPDRPDLKRNKALAGQVVRQKTKIGVFDVHYNEDGYGVKSVRVK